ncbi:hypothetical protein ABID21_000455 [Pseudorhizobium tarimense]|uniref:Uncharacterized protein n=1 Tax=Pseudorhizobium tarimense TaxID=1079109 RepID=A0ABV2H1E1_9HYPH
MIVSRETAEHYTWETSARFTADLCKLEVESGNNCRSATLLTDAQSQGTKMPSTVARGGKYREYKGNF